ncbi:hypothetical protein MSPP1_002124 [Malassezia sp. CBS 17886]|nr:hypothetical protein MSPP1_002124 [Malassezia sp. CBS 17886]
MATSALAKQFLEIITKRRSYYALSKDPILPDADLVKLVQATVRQAPSSFNVQSSRVVILLGKEHDRYWGETVPGALLAAKGEKAVTASKPKLDAFQAGYGTVLFFEDHKLIEGQQEQFPSYATEFPKWSFQSSGMAQVYTWTMLEAEGYGANLQHYGNLTVETVRKQFNLPASYNLLSEMVFGTIANPAGEKTFVPDHERVIAFGHST